VVTVAVLSQNDDTLAQNCFPEYTTFADEYPKCLNEGPSTTNGFCTCLSGLSSTAPIATKCQYNTLGKRFWVQLQDDIIKNYRDCSNANLDGSFASCRKQERIAAYLNFECRQCSTCTTQSTGRRFKRFGALFSNLKHRNL